MAKASHIINQLFVLARDKERVAAARIVAAVVYKGKIISYGFNQTRTSWIQRRFKANEHSMFLHAETDAIRNALKTLDVNSLSNATLYVVRSKKINGIDVFGSAKPCRGCASCIEWAGIKKVYYTTDHGSVDKLEI